MKSSLILRLLPAVAALSLATGALRADIIILKTGEKYEGKILEETPDKIKIEYKLTPKIKDTKLIDKATIQEIKKQTPSESEIEDKGLRKLLPTADLLTAGEYESLIQDRLRPFVAKYPGTPEAAEVEKMIATLSDEKTKVTSGQIKVEGKWLDSSAVKKDAYNIDAYSLRYQMKMKAAEPNDMRYLTALRVFDKLRTTFPASLHYVQAIPEALEIMTAYEKQINGMIQMQPSKAKDRELGLKSLTGSDSTLTRNAIQKEEQDYKHALELQVKAKTTWKDIYAYDLKGLQDALATIQIVRKDLKALDLDVLRRDNEVYLAVIRYIADGKVSEAESAVERAAKSTTGGPSSPILSGLRKQTEELKRKAEQMKLQATKNSTIQSPTLTEQPADANPMADALKQVEAKRKKEAEAKKKAQEEKQDAAAKKAALLAPHPVEEEGFLSQYGIYLGGGLAIVLVVAIFLARRSKKEE